MSARLGAAARSLSAINAAYQEIFRPSETLTALRQHEGAELIIEVRAAELSRSFNRLVHLLSGKGPLFSPQLDPPLTSPLPAEMVVLPFRRTPGLPIESPMFAGDVRLVGSTALIQFPAALAVVDLHSGHFSVQPFFGGSFSAVTEGRQAFKLPLKPRCVGFNVSGTQLAAVDSRAITVFSVLPTGKPKVMKRWSVSALRAHLTPGKLSLAGTGLTPETLMGTAGTIGAMRELSSTQLIEGVFFEDGEEPGPQAIERLLGDARRLKLPTELKPL